MAKNRIDYKDVKAHIYEYTTQLSIDPDLKFKGLEKGIVPVSSIIYVMHKSADLYDYFIDSNYVLLEREGALDSFTFANLSIRLLSSKIYRSEWKHVFYS